jgi:MFS family permease
MTRAAQDGWATATTIGLLVASAALILTFLAIEIRSSAPLLPLRIFQNRTLSAANITGFLVGAALFSQFFLLTLYMQDVLHYSAIETGVAYLTLTLAIIVFAAVAQGLVTRVGVRRVLPVGLALSAAGLVLFTQLPVDGHYFWDIFPGFLVSGIGLALSFVPMTIAALIGVDETDAGIASGLINTSQQIGGAVGLAAATTIAVTFTNRYLDSHAGASASSAAALDYGYQIAFWVLAALAAIASVVAAVMIEPNARGVEGELALEKAA